MIVKCVNNQLADIPEEYLLLSPDTVNDHTVACSLGKAYIVYAIRTDEESQAKWYFLYTDSGYLWWMPAVLFETIDDTLPAGWQTEKVFGGDVISSYPSLADWKIQEGIIDGERAAEVTYLNEVKADKTFPSESQLDELNKEFDKQKKMQQYKHDLKIAIENGWERPQMPDDRD